MTISNRIANPLLSGIFIRGGIDAIRNPESKVKYAERVTRPLSQTIAVLPDDPATLIRLNGGLQVAAGVLLSVGKFRRLAALALIGSIVPTTIAGHAFWSEVDEEKRAQQQTHFFKNLGLLGGLILAVADTDGAPSATWKIKRTVRRVRGAPSPGIGRKLRVRSKQVSEAGAQRLHQIDDAASLGAQVLGSVLSTGVDLTGNLLSDATDRIAAAASA
jgi:putative oxidoreductase